MTGHSVGTRVAIKRDARIMATRVGIHVACDSGDAAMAVERVEACLNWLREIERRLTRFDASSELSMLNASTGEWHAVSDLLFAVVEQSLVAARASGGLFDPTLLPALERLGYDRDFAEVAAAGQEAGDEDEPIAASVGTWRAMELDHEHCRVFFPAGARLDLGGIAKGWAADVALDQFFGDALPDVLIDVGGDMRARGRGANGEPWPIGVRNPVTEATARPEDGVVVSLASGALACSGATDRWWRRGGELRHHLLDPRTGRPARLWVDAAEGNLGGEPVIATVTAFAPTAAHAEVAAKVAVLRGYPDALRVVESAWTASASASESVDGGVAMLLVMGNGAVVHSANLREWLADQGGGGELWLD